ncbi:MAG: hypothetical protein PUC77_05260 [Bacteroidales bacterium]|nr:hypothetical protein [Bacteroidales bacterium]
MKKFSIYTVLMVFVFAISSCGSFGEGMLMGLAGCGTGSAYGSMYGNSMMATSPVTSNYSTWNSGNYASTSYASAGSSYSSSGTTTSSTKRSGTSTGSTSAGRKCAYCNGTGKVTKYYSTPTYGLPETKKHCSECGKDYYPSNGHSHVHCSHCHGTGYIK